MLFVPHAANEVVVVVAVRVVGMVVRIVVETVAVVVVKLVVEKLSVVETSAGTTVDVEVTVWVVTLVTIGVAAVFVVVEPIRTTASV